MALMDKMEQKFEQAISPLSEKEQLFFRKIKVWFFSIYNFIKPIAIAITVFWIFTRIKNAVGHEQSLFIIGVVIIILLRAILSRLS